MKKGKLMIVLLSVLVLIIIAIFVVKAISKKKEELSKIDEVVFELDTASVTSILWNKDECSLRFNMVDGAWIYDYDNSYPVDTELVDNVLKHLESVHACFIIENVEDYDQYGLGEDPVGFIKITTAEGESTIKLGSYSSIDQIRYIEVGDGNVYMVSDDLLKDYSITLSDYIRLDQFPEYDQITKLTYVSDDQTFVLYYDENKDTYLEDVVWWMDFPDSDNELDHNIPVLTDSAESYLKWTASSTGLTTSKYLTYTASQDDLSEYGLDKPMATITVEGLNYEEDGTTVKETGSYTYSAGYGPEADYAYARMEGSEFVYKINTTSGLEIQNNSGDVIADRHVVYVQNWEQAKNISFDFEGDTYSIDFEWQLKLDYQGVEMADTYVCNARGQISLDAVMDAIDALEMTHFDHSDVSDKTLEFTATLQLNISEKDYEFKMDFYRYNSSEVLVAVNGNVVGILDRDLMSDFREACTQCALEVLARDTAN